MTFIARTEHSISKFQFQEGEMKLEEIPQNESSRFLYGTLIYIRLRMASVSYSGNQSLGKESKLSTPKKAYLSQFAYQKRYQVKLLYPFSAKFLFDVLQIQFYFPVS